MNAETRVLRVLIVDDHPNFRHIFRTRLNQLPSILVEEAATGREALEKTDALLPALIFVDIDLPDANGLELTRVIKAKHPGIRIAIMTCHNLPGTPGVGDKVRSRPVFYQRFVKLE